MKASSQARLLKAAAALLLASGSPEWSLQGSSEDERPCYLWNFTSWKWKWNQQYFLSLVQAQLYLLALFCSLQDPSGPILVSRDLKFLFFFLRSLLCLVRKPEMSWSVEIVLGSWKEQSGIVKTRHRGLSKDSLHTACMQHFPQADAPALCTCTLSHSVKVSRFLQGFLSILPGEDA